MVKYYNPNEPPQKTKKIHWGIIRYAPGSGLTPEEDAAAFDGWYTHFADAKNTATLWLERHPQWIIAIVRADEVWFGDGDFTSVSNRALTVREVQFKNGS
jgi:hypothetical protein